MFCYDSFPHPLYVYDTTLRDGAQTPGLSLSAQKKALIATWLDDFGVPYIEGGWPGANDTDTQFFASDLTLRQAKLAAFGMTCRTGIDPKDDKGFQTVLQSPRARAVCLVGKSSAYQAKTALKISAKANLDLIRLSMAEARRHHDDVLFDAEHFFDGFMEDPTYALTCLRTALDAGATWLVLCDTKGGTGTDEVRAIVRHVRKALPSARLGFHGHNDMGLAEANSIAAVQAGCTMVQGTLGGLGERCGNANLFTLLPTFINKMGLPVVGMDRDSMKGLKALAVSFYALLGMPLPANLPYVGRNAFRHKAGIHASAIARDPSTYEHMDPRDIGAQSEVVVSNQAGLSNLAARLGAEGISVPDKDPALKKALQRIKKHEANGYSYDDAGASFALLALESLGQFAPPFTVERYTITSFGTPEGGARSRARVTINLGHKMVKASHTGDGPVHALDQALRQALVQSNPDLASLQLTEYKADILEGHTGTGSTTRVHVTTFDPEAQARWTTVGVSSDITQASLTALVDAYAYKLYRIECDRHAKSSDHSSAPATGRKYRHDGAGDGELCVDGITHRPSAGSLAVGTVATKTDGSCVLGG